MYECVDDIYVREKIMRRETAYKVFINVRWVVAKVDSKYLYACEK